MFVKKILKQWNSNVALRVIRKFLNENVRFFIEYKNIQMKKIKKSPGFGPMTLPNLFEIH